MSVQLYKKFQFFTQQECDDIINYARVQQTERGKARGDKNKSIRKNRIVWYRDSKKWKEWIAMFNKIEPVIDWIQNPQISFYSPGEYYDWHKDSTHLSQRTHIRHFSLTCELQTAENSIFEIKNHSIEPLSKGEAIIFLSSDLHRVTTPISGERISFTIWAMAKNTNKLTDSQSVVQ
jgi:predicted 2-oxoglutarate/Fe(II)-dependent dioxygenase YbiX